MCRVTQQEEGKEWKDLEGTKSGTYIDLVSLVALVQVVHDGTPVELRQGGHVIHALLIHGVHGHHLLVCNCALLVREYLVG